MVKGLFVCCVFLDYVSLSRRFVPELVNFLLGVLYIAAPNAHGRGELVHGVLSSVFCRSVVLSRPRPLWSAWAVGALDR